MNLDQHTEQRQELRLTTELRQGIAIMQMSATELSEYVRQRVEENPFLDDDDWEWPRHSQTGEVYAKTTSADVLVENARAANAYEVSERFDPATPYTASREAFRDRAFPSGEGMPLPTSSSEGFAFENYLASEETLEDHLLAQLNLQVRSLRDRATGEYLIGSLDGSGYLRVTVEAVAKALDVAESDVERVLEIIQRFEPLGVGARDIAECFRIQLEARGLMGVAGIRALLDEGIWGLGKVGPAQMAKQLGITLAELDAALDVLRTCNPWPGAQFGKPSDPIWPEVVVERAGHVDETTPDAGSSRYTVRLQDFFLPHLRVNGYYKTLATSEKAQGSKGAQDYLTAMLKEAESLIDSIHYRKLTLFKVASCVVEFQSAFFDEGYAALAPLSMETVARMTGVSESTISRVANGNYLQTPRGVFELRFFFQRSAATEGGRAVSQGSVKHRIGSLVEQENPQDPLSDQAIADRLAQEGVPLSRRTVSKYRAELGIPARAFRVCG